MKVKVTVVVEVEVEVKKCRYGQPELKFVCVESKVVTCLRRATGVHEGCGENKVKQLATASLPRGMRFSVPL